MRPVRLDLRPARFVRDRVLAASFYVVGDRGASRLGFAEPHLGGHAHGEEVVRETAQRPQRLAIAAGDIIRPGEIATKPQRGIRGAFNRCPRPRRGFVAEPGVGENP